MRLRRRQPLIAPLLRSRLLVAGLLLAAAACRRPGAGTDPDGARVTMTVSPQPPVVGTAQVELALADEAGGPLSATSVDVVGNMTHPGMVPTRAAARSVEPGRWRADLALTMPGDWIVEVEARLADGTTVRREMPLPDVLSR